tara:strand:+ start:208 stop:408 length:201 start_codon:yes stop_codon:yes gene_type:complete
MLDDKNLNESEKQKENIKRNKAKVEEDKQLEEERRKFQALLPAEKAEQTRQKLVLFLQEQEVSELN